MNSIREEIKSMLNKFRVTHKPRAFEPVEVGKGFSRADETDLLANELETYINKVREEMLDDFEFAIRCALNEDGTKCSTDVLKTHLQSIKEQDK